MKHLQYLNQYFLRYKKLFGLGFIFVVLSNYFRVLQPQMIRQAFDLVIENIGYYNQLEGFEVQQDLFSYIGKILLFFGLLVVGLAILMGIFMYFMRQTIIVMSRLIEYDLRKAIYLHYQKLDQAFYRKNNTGDLMARITEDVNKVRTYLGPAVLYGINLVSLFALVIYAMLSVNVELTLYSLAPLPILSIAIYYISNLINKKSTIIQKKLASLNSNAQEVYSGIRVVKSYVQEKFMGKYFAEQSEEYRKNSLALVKVDALFTPLVILLIGTSTVITVLIGGIKVVQGILTPGNIAEFVIYVNMLVFPVIAIGYIASIIQQAAASQKRINEFLDTQPAIVSTATDETPLKGKITFENVTFKYPDTGIVALKDLNLELLPGQKMAIIGRTGSGKTTIADLVTRMYDVSSGSIKIDDRDLRDHNVHNLRQRIGYVTQDVFLFSDTISRNIAFGKRDASQEEIEKYAKYASIYNEIKDLPEGFETLVGERGVTLSGGQKQRTSIARALIKQPDILLLDDCLSAVDTKTENQILNYFEEALSDKTVIIITHRIYSLIEFDKIIVLEDGKIVEAGTHSELLTQDGYYNSLYQKQIREEVIEEA